VGKYLILHGGHRIKSTHNEDGTIIPGCNKHRGDIVESELDLENRHPEKFRRVPDDVVVPEGPAAPENAPNDNHATYDAMTLAELRQYAEGEGIDISKAKTKESIIKLIEMSS